jgi:primosomal protein N''
MLFFSNPPLLDVVYNKERVLMGQSVRRDDPERARQINALIRRKSPHWQYEREWRQLYFLQNCISEVDEKDGSENYFKQFEADLINQVILGCRVDSALEKEVHELLSQDRFSHVKLLKYQMHDKEFALIPEP